MQTQLNPTIFKTYDIHGIAGKTVDAETARLIGRTFSSTACAKDESAVVIGRDGRLSDPELFVALADDLRASGVDVIDLGLVATPMVYFGTNIELAGRRAASGVVVTGSHNPPDYDGLKMVLIGQTVYGKQIRVLRTRIEQGDFTGGSDDCIQVDICQQYIDRVVSDVELNHPMKIAVDCGNGVAGAFAPELLRAMGYEVTELFCEVDSHFPNHHPDLAHVENLQGLVRTLRITDCELGLAFDGDGDRLGVITKDGQVIFPDRQLILFVQEVLSHNSGGGIIFDVKCAGKLTPLIHEHDGKTTMWKTSHSLVKAKLGEMGAPLADEMSGRIFSKDHWYGFDDGLYTGIRLLEIVSRLADPSTALNALPNSRCTPELQLKCAESGSFELLDRIKASATFAGTKEVNRIDGVRVEYEDGFGLARPSNTTPVVVMRFEADNDAAMTRIQSKFRHVILTEEPNAQLPF